MSKAPTYQAPDRRILESDVSQGPAITTQGGTRILDAASAITDRWGFKAVITDTHVLATKGVIHVIDKFSRRRRDGAICFSVSSYQP